jgi:hypothetical protein
VIVSLDLGDVPLVLGARQDAVLVESAFGIQVVAKTSVTCISAVFKCRRICMSHTRSNDVSLQHIPYKLMLLVRPKYIAHCCESLSAPSSEIVQ